MAINPVRFSKAAFVRYLRDKIKDIQQVHNFDPNNGYAQVETKSDRIKYDYGRYAGFVDLLEDVESGLMTW